MDERELRRLLLLEPSDYVVRALAAEVRRLSHELAAAEADLARRRPGDSPCQPRQQPTAR